METGSIRSARFIFKAHKYQLVQLDIVFTPTEDVSKAGLMKTSFRVYLDDEYIGYVPLDMLAIIPEDTKDPHSKLQIIIKTGKPSGFNSLPFAKDMKLNKFLGKVFKQDHMTEIKVDENTTVVVRDKRTIKRGRRKNKK